MSEYIQHIDSIVTSIATIVICIVGYNAHRNSKNSLRSAKAIELFYESIHPAKLHNPATQSKDEKE